MSIQDRKSRENEDLKRKILTAALRIFAEHGYREISMRKIAALIEYSPTTIYRFFKNKEDLLGAIVIETYGELASRFEKAGRESAYEDPLEMLKSIVREYVVFCVERPEMFRLLSDVAEFEAEDGIIYERLGQTRRQVFQSWFAGIRRALAAGDLRIEDEMRIFLYLWHAADGYVYDEVFHPGLPRKPLAEDAAGYLDLIFEAIKIGKTEKGELR